MATILVADDDDIFAAIIESTLTPEGHVVHCVDDGAKALEHLKSEHCDLLICDCMMPAVDGFTLVTEIQRWPQNPAAAIIFTSARRDLHALIKERDLNVDAVLSKPFNVGDFIKRVNELTAEPVS